MAEREAWTPARIAELRALCKEEGLWYLRAAKALPEALDEIEHSRREASVFRTMLEAQGWKPDNLVELVEGHAKARQMATVYEKPAGSEQGQAG